VVLFCELFSLIIVVVLMLDNYCALETSTNTQETPPHAQLHSRVQQENHQHSTESLHEHEKTFRTESKHCIGKRELVYKYIF
jgi:hypothetical protein